jgi:hypothetical protein
MFKAFSNIEKLLGVKEVPPTGKIIINKKDDEGDEYTIDFSIFFKDGKYYINDNGKTFADYIITTKEFIDATSKILKKYQINFKNGELFTIVDDINHLKVRKKDFIKALTKIYETIR